MPDAIEQAASAHHEALHGTPWEQMDGIYQTEYEYAMRLAIDAYGHAINQLKRK